MKEFIIKYVEDENEENVKYYMVRGANSKKQAHDVVCNYIEENDHHPSVNYGYTLTSVRSAPIIHYTIEENSCIFQFYGDWPTAI